MKIFRYGMWVLTLIVVSWALAIISLLIGGKGIDRRAPIRATED